MKKTLEAGLLAAAVMTACLAHAATEPLAQANAALQSGEADNALTLLNSLPPSAEVHNLKCRVLFTLEQFDASGSECERAVKMDGQNSDYHMWLGRTFGERADHAFFLAAVSLAKRVRTEFEEAVRLNPHNAAALADLGEFCYSAPGVVGGGVSRAEEIAAQLDKLDPVRAHELHGRIAETRKDYATAEREFKQGIAVSEHPAFQWMTLANFYARRNRWADMKAAMQTGVKAVHQDQHAAVALFNGASTLSSYHIELPLAAKMFEDYLASPAKSEEAPAFVAHTRLAHVEAELGDIAAARREQAATLALAQNYRPAHDLKF